jgi:transposase
MGAPVALREGFDSRELRRLAAETKDADQARRLLALAAVYDGMSREDAARIGGMERQTLRDWVHRFNSDGADGLIDAKSPGRPQKLSVEQQEELRRLVEAGPDPDKDGVVRWRCVDLKRVLGERFNVDLSEVSLGRVLKRLGFSRISARPLHPAQDHEAIATFKKNFPGRRRTGGEFACARNPDRGVVPG